MQSTAEAERHLEKEGQDADDVGLEQNAQRLGQALEREQRALHNHTAMQGGPHSLLRSPQAGINNARTHHLQ